MQLKTQTYSYSFIATAILLLSTSAIAGFFLYKHPEAPIFIPLIAGAPTLLACVWFIIKVEVDAEHIHIKPLLPFRKSKTLTHADVEFYAPIRPQGKQKPGTFGGFLKPRGEAESIMITRLGTQNFDVLSELLEASYPKPPLR